MSACTILPYIASGAVIIAFALMALILGVLAWLLLGDDRRADAAACAIGAILYIAVGGFLAWEILQ